LFKRERLAHGFAEDGDAAGFQDATDLPCNGKGIPVPQDGICENAMSSEVFDRDPGGFRNIHGNHARAERCKTRPVRLSAAPEVHDSLSANVSKQLKSEFEGVRKRKHFPKTSAELDSKPVAF
jgi:hypothetical protein